MSPLVALLTFPARWWRSAQATPEPDTRPAAITYVRTGSNARLRRHA